MVPWTRRRAWLAASLHRSDPGTFARIASQPVQPVYVAAGWAACFGALMLTIVRWHLLVRAVGLPFGMRDAVRLGLLGYFCNFFSLGSVGGDVAKAVGLARREPARRTVAISTPRSDVVTHSRS